MLSILFGLVTVAITCFAVYELWMVIKFWRTRSIIAANLPQIKTPAIPRTHAPSVLVQLPIYNEVQVVEQLIAQTSLLDYPANAIKIQILDDSDDDTTQLIRIALKRLSPEKAALFSHMRRGDRKGYKAGALAHGMTLDSATFIAIFDADFLPPPDFLSRALLETNSFDDSQVCFVQGRWSYYNADDTLFTRIQSLLLDRHYLVQKPFQAATKMHIIFNGSAGIWRRAAIEEAGGWLSRTLTEDLDLTMRSMLCGKHGVYDPGLCVENEIPRDLRAFKMQQRRWATGTAQAMRHLFGSVARRGSFLQRANNLFAISGYIVHPLLFIYAVMWPTLVLGGTNLVYLWICQIALVLGNGAAIAGLVTTFKLRSGTLFDRKLFMEVGCAMGLGLSLMINNMTAFITGLLHDGGVFMRTPKAGKSRHTQTSLSIDKVILIEAGFAIYALLAAALMLSRGYFMEFQQTFLFGCVMATLVIVQARQYLASKTLKVTT